MSGFLGRLALAAAFLAAVASLTLDPAAGTSRAETLYLAKMALLVGVAVAALAPRRWGALAAAAVLVLAALIVVPAGPARPVLVMAGLAVLFALSAWRALRELVTDTAPGWRDRLTTCVGLALGAWVLLCPESGLGSLTEPLRVARLLLVPLLVAVVLVALMRLIGPRVRGAVPRGIGTALALFGVPVFLAATVLSSYPWARADPLVAAAKLTARGVPAAPTLVLLEGSEVALDEPRETVGAELADLPARRIVIDSRLANAALLPAGTVVATFRLRDAAGEAYEFPLRAGLDTGEWAARRADVAALPGFSAPEAYRVEIEPAGAFFGSTYRAHWVLPGARTARHIEVTRSENLPQNLVIAISRVEIRP